MDWRYPALKVTRKTGQEPIGSTGFSVSDYWVWAHSDLNSNAERGKLAEYLMKLAMGCTDEISSEWGVYDLLSPKGIKIEVKTSALLQTWEQNEFSKLSFGINPTREWSDETNAFLTEPRHQADVYVFCVEHCQDQASLNPLDLEQWDFYPLATAKLDQSVGPQATIGLPSLLGLGATKVNFAGLREAVIQEYQA